MTNSETDNIEQITRPYFNINEFKDIVDELNKICFEKLGSSQKDIDRFFEIKALVDHLKLKQKEYRLIRRSQSRRKAIDQLEEWAKGQGIYNAGVKIKEFKGQGYGLEAVNDIQEEDVFLKIPKSMMMTFATAMNTTLKVMYRFLCCKHEELVSSNHLDHFPTVVMALHLLDEISKEDSFWRPYLNILPYDYHSILQYSEADFRLLIGMPMFTDCMNTYRYMVRQYILIFEIFEKDMTGIFPYVNLTIEDYCWALTTVYSRQNEICDKNGESMLALIPYWDMCNHSSMGKPSKKQQEVMTFWNPFQGQIDCFSINNFKKGEQVFMYYGHRSNYQLMLYSGFVEVKNQRDVFPLTLGISSGDSLGPLKLQLLQTIIPENMNLMKKAGKFDLKNDCMPLDFQLLIFLRVFCMTKETLQHYIKFKDVKLSDLYDTTSTITIDNLDYKAWSYLLARLDLLIAHSDGQAFMKYTHIDNDELVISPGLTECGEIAVNFRLCERRTLMNIRTKCLCNLSMPNVQL